MLESRFGESFSDSSLWVVVVEQALIQRVLRYYAMIKYADVGKDNWFDYFGKAVKPMIRGRTEMMITCATDPDDSFSQVLGEGYSKMIEQLKKQPRECPCQGPI